MKFFNLLIGLPLEAEGGSLSPNLYITIALVGSMLQMQHQYPADPNTSPILSLQNYQPVVGEKSFFLL